MMKSLDQKKNWKNYWNLINNFFGLTHIVYKFKNSNESFDNVLKSVKKQFKEQDVNRILDMASNFIAYE